MKTVLETIQGGTDYLAKGGVDSPRLSMEHLVAHVLGCARMQLYVDFDRPLGEDELGPLRDLVKRRRGGEPLQHLLGTSVFFGREFRCDARALVPRPETEELVSVVLEECRPLVEGAAAGGGLHVLDMGCGSGVIGLTLAVELAGAAASVTLADLSPEALSLARENAAAVGAAGDADGDGGPGRVPEIEFIESDLFAGLAGREFDVVVANLPYVRSGEVSSLSKEVGHDPSLALDGGPAGHELIGRFVEALPGHVGGRALVALEIGSGQGGVVGEMLAGVGAGGIAARRDLSGNERFVTGWFGAGDS